MAKSRLVIISVVQTMQFKLADFSIKTMPSNTVIKKYRNLWASPKIQKKKQPNYYQNIIIRRIGEEIKGVLLGTLTFLLDNLI